MPKYSYSNCPDFKASQGQKNERKVGYFKLKPGEKAIVRFAYTTANEVEIATIHEVKIKDKIRSVLCIRDAKEPLDKCPLCANGTPIKARAFVKLLHYVLDDQGKVTDIFSEVASFPKKYADILVARNNEYGDLQDNLFSITRIGSGKETSYDIQYANPMKYNEANGFVKDFSDFEGFELSPHSYIERSKEDIEEFLQSGEFPFRKKNNDEQQTVVMTADSVEPVDVAAQVAKQQISQPQFAVGAETVVTNVQSTPAQDNDVYSRPRRTYDIIK